MELWVPYGETEIPVRIPDDNFYRILEPTKPGAKDVASLIQQALEHPIAASPLDSVVKPGGTAGIVVDPIVPIEIMQEAVRTLTSRLSSLGVEKTRVFVRRRLSTAYSSDEGYKHLDPSQNSFQEIGKTAMGTIVDVDPELSSCETKIHVGLVSPHFATGFTGGPESVIPSCSSLRSIGKNRALLMKGLPIHSASADNTVLSDSLEACRLAGPIYNLCFVPDGLGGVGSVLAGELEPVFREAVSRFSDVHMPRIERRVDIIVVSAGRLGLDLYHGIRVISNVLGALRKDGTIILVAECSKGVGDSGFLDYARRFRERKELLAELRYRFRLGGHVNAFLQEVLESCRVQLVSVLPELFVRDTFNLKASQAASEAVQKAIRFEGKESKILLVPKGDLTIPVMDSS